MSEPSLTQFSSALADAAERALASVVTVWAAPGRPISGTVVGPEQVLTVQHVLGGDTATVETAGARIEATVAGRDAALDLALLRVPGLTLSPVRAGGAARLGALVLATARPGGSPMVSHGVVSGVDVRAGFGGRRGGGRRGGARGGWLRTDASPYPGFSGGALVDASGALVGIVNAGVSRGEIFAVPAEAALESARLLAEKGSVPRGFLGVSTQPVKLPDGKVGLLVVGVEPGSPAEAGGLVLGDVLLRWDGEELGSPDALLEGVLSGAGQTVRLGVLRGGQPAELTVTLGERGR